jgi:TRAP-type mannitol/chloroaromatic compound transport system permease small subunit
MKTFGNILGIGIVLMIVLSFVAIGLHTFINFTSIPMQELIVYLHSSIFMLGIVYAFSHDKHVRIDIFYQNKSETSKKRINFFGTLFLLIPFCLFLFYASYTYVLSSWSRLEGSAEPGGLPFVYGLKSLLLILPALLIATAIVSLWRKR